MPFVAPSPSPLPLSSRSSSGIFVKPEDDVSATGYEDEKLSHLSTLPAAEESGGLEGKEQSGGEPVAPLRHKAIALGLIVLFTLGSHFAESSLGPLKSTIKAAHWKSVEGDNINNAQYGAIAAADALVNTVLPLFTGLAIDYYGPRPAAVVSCAFILAGQCLSSIGATVRSFPLLVFGQVILGFGSLTIDIQNKLYVHWFTGSSLGLVLGINIGVGRAFQMSAALSAVPIARSTGNWVWSFWVPTIFCAGSLGATVLYALFERQLLGLASHNVTGRRIARAAALESGVKLGRRARLSATWQWILACVFALPAAFWLLCISQLFQSAVAQTYLSNVANMVQVTRGASKLTAGYTSAVAQVLPVFIAPILGALFDSIGHRMHFVSTMAVLWILTFALLGFTQINAFAPILVGSLALALNIIPYIAAIPLLVPDHRTMGLAYSLWKIFTSFGTTILGVVAGALQDSLPSGPKQYTRVFLLMIAFKAFDFFLGMTYLWFDKRHLGGVLMATEKELNAEREEDENEQAGGVGRGWRGPMKGVTVSGMVTGLGFLVVSWVVYLYFTAA